MCQRRVAHRGSLYSHNYGCEWAHPGNGGGRMHLAALYIIMTANARPSTGPPAVCLLLPHGQLGRYDTSRSECETRAVRGQRGFTGSPVLFSPFLIPVPALPRELVWKRSGRGTVTSVPDGIAAGRGCFAAKLCTETWLALA